MKDYIRGFTTLSDEEIVKFAKERLMTVGGENGDIMLCPYGNKKEYAENGYCYSDCSDYYCRQVKVHIVIETVTPSPKMKEAK